MGLVLWGFIIQSRRKERRPVLHSVKMVLKSTTPPKQMSLHRCEAYAIRVDSKGLFIRGAPKVSSGPLWQQIQEISDGTTFLSGYHTEGQCSHIPKDYEGRAEMATPFIGLEIVTLSLASTTGNLTLTPIQGAGDGMETEEPPKSVEVTSEVQPINQNVLQSPCKKVPLNSPAVLQLGKILTEKAVEVETVRIFVPKAAITHDIPTKNTKLRSPGHHRDEVHLQPEVVTDTWKELTEAKKLSEKLKNSERRLLQDKEGLSNQLRVQTE
ncbi:hypothetical protein STEG23_011522, partial [Scotinomys teguina]